MLPSKDSCITAALCRSGVQPNGFTSADRQWAEANIRTGKAVRPQKLADISLSVSSGSSKVVQFSVSYS